MLLMPSLSSGPKFGAVILCQNRTPSGHSFLIPTKSTCEALEIPLDGVYETSENNQADIRVRIGADVFNLTAITDLITMDMGRTASGRLTEFATTSAEQGAGAPWHVWLDLLSRVLNSITGKELHGSRNALNQLLDENKAQQKQNTPNDPKTACLPDSAFVSEGGHQFVVLTPEFPLGEDARFVRCQS
jgi:hypothetical protein